MPEGGCQCGAVRYRLGGAMQGAGICHCESCRRSTGAQSVAWITVPAEGFTLLRGEPVAYASSPGVIRRFCGRCGTALTYQSEPESVDVTIASLDDPEAVVPVKEIWLSHRLSWEAVDPSRPGYPEGGT